MRNFLALGFVPPTRIASKPVDNYKCTSMRRRVEALCGEGLSPPDPKGCAAEYRGTVRILFFPKQLKVQGSSGVRFQQGSGDSGLVLRTPGARFKGSSKVPQNPSNGSKGSGWSGAGQV